MKWRFHCSGFCQASFGWVFVALLAYTCCCQCWVGGKTSSSLLTDEREAVQKKTFTKWVNSHLARVSCRITDLYTDLRDGRMLIKLLEVLSGERLVSGNDSVLSQRWENTFEKSGVGLSSVEFCN
jgi:hypothetical protein